MPAKKPTLSDLMSFINDFGVNMGAELAMLRTQVTALTKEVEALKTPVKSYLKPDYTPPLNAFEEGLVQASKVVDAIVTYRARVQAAGGYIGLKEAKDFVEAYKAEFLSLQALQGINTLFDENDPLPLTAAQQTLVKNGDKILAIKDYRNHVQNVCGEACSLKAAVGVVNAFLASQGWGGQIGQ